MKLYYNTILYIKSKDNPKIFNTNNLGLLSRYQVKDVMNELYNKNYELDMSDDNNFVPIEAYEVNDAATYSFNRETDTIKLQFSVCTINTLTDRELIDKLKIIE